MTRNQLLPNNVENGSDGVMFSVDAGGNITSAARTTVHRGQTIVTQAATGATTFTGHVCAQRNKLCQCATLVDGVSSGNHMALGTGYTVKQSVALGSTFALYAVSDSGPVANATNGDIVIGTT